MEIATTVRHFDRLRKRRDQVAVTLRHLEKEHREVERNTDWLDQAAYESRVRLLDRLTEWYFDELHKIDEALKRAEKNKYGSCAACHRPIEPARLDAEPDTEFCAACQTVREELETA